LILQLSRIESPLTMSLSAGSAPKPRDDLLREIESGAFEELSTQEILVWAIKTFHPRIALSCSFGAPEGMMLLDMLSRIEPGFRVFTLDTGRIPQATYDLMDRIRDRYDKQIEVLFPDSKAVEGSSAAGCGRWTLSGVTSRASTPGSRACAGTKGSRGLRSTKSSSTRRIPGSSR